MWHRRPFRIGWLVVALVLPTIVGPHTVPAAVAPEDVLPPGNQMARPAETGEVNPHSYVQGYPAVADGPSGRANELASGVMRAGTEQSRFDALVEVMRALNVGVYTPDASPVIRGAERGVGDFYVYDVELRMMAHSLGRHDLYDAEAIATMLSQMLVPGDDTPIAPETLRQVLLAGTASARQSPDDPLSLVPLIVRQLGLGHERRYDLFQEVPLTRLRFDALQTFLVLIDATLPIVAEHGPIPTAASNLAALSGGILAAVQVDGHPCATIDAQVMKEAWPVGKFWLFLAPKVPPAIRLATVVIDGIHGVMLAYSVRVEATSPVSQVTHYGPAGHHADAGRELQFSVHVEMLDDLPENVIQCAWIAGLEVPQKGPIAGVTIGWALLGATTARGDLERHGRIDCPDVGCKKTGADGTATLRFRPKEETYRDEGALHTDSGWFKAFALYQSRHKNYVGTVNQFLTPKLVTFWWDVGYHEIETWVVRLRLDYDITVTSRPGQAPYRGAVSGSETYEVRFLDAVLTPPWYASTEADFTASGSGAVMSSDGSGTCEQTFRGDWSGPVHLDDDGARNRFERIAKIRLGAGLVGPPQELFAPANVWCSSVAPHGADFWINLETSGPQVFDVSDDACASSRNVLLRNCVGEAVWTVTVFPPGDG